MRSRWSSSTRKWHFWVNVAPTEFALCVTKRCSINELLKSFLVPFFVVSIVNPDEQLTKRTKQIGRKRKILRKGQWYCFSVNTHFVVLQRLHSKYPGEGTGDPVPEFTTMLVGNWNGKTGNNAKLGRNEDLPSEQLRFFDSFTGSHLLWLNTVQKQRIHFLEEIYVSWLQDVQRRQNLQWNSEIGIVRQKMPSHATSNLRGHLSESQQGTKYVIVWHLQRMALQGTKKRPFQYAYIKYVSGTPGELWSNYPVLNV